MAFDVSTAMQSAFFREVEGLCRNLGPPASLRGERVVFEVAAEGEPKPCNMSASYAPSFGSGAAEHVQNWWDECIVALKTGQPVIHPVVPAVLAEVAQRHQIKSDAKAYAACGQGRLLGILLDCTTATGQQLLLFKEYGAQMNMDCLILGVSSKRKDHRLAGQFGEGGKVEINRLVQEGCTVRYWTGNAAWTFAQQTARHCTIPELHVKVQPGPDLYDFVGMAVMSTPNYRGRLLDVERFLFLQGQYNKISAPPLPSGSMSGMELLLDQRHHGKVFIKGIFVAEASTYKAFGINYTGAIFSLLGLGRDRNTVNERYLVMGIPKMMADVQRRTDSSGQPSGSYDTDVAELAKLMSHENTGLKAIVDNYYNPFDNASEDEEQLAKGLYDYFKKHHPSALPICSKCAESSDQAQADDLRYLGFETVEVPETAYLLFRKAGLLQSREDLWEIRRQQILAQPDPLQGLSAEKKAGYENLVKELETVCKKYVRPGQICFREFPPGNLYVLRGFSTDFVIDSIIVCDPDQVHSRLAAMLGSGIQCQQPCQCLRKLLLHSMVDALSRQKGGPTKERILNDIVGGYIGASHYHHDLPASTNTGNSHHTASTGPSIADPDAGPVAMDVCSSPKQNSSNGRSAPVAHQTAISPNLANNSTVVSSSMHNSQAGPSHVGALASRPPTVRIVQERAALVTPGTHDPVLFHNGIQAALASVLRHSAGQDCSEGIMRSCNHPSAEGSADTVTVRLCPTQSKHPIKPSDVRLRSCLPHGIEKRLYLPEGFDDSSWLPCQSDAAQRLYHLLECLHELMSPGVAPVNLYYDADDECIAFNRGNKLWYNAYADKVYDQSPQGVRLFNWYITVCHELAHNFQKQHDEVFSDYLAHIALQHSRGFYALCEHYNIDMS